MTESVAVPTIQKRKATSRIRLYRDDGQAGLIEFPAEILEHTQFRVGDQCFQVFGTEADGDGVVGLAREIDPRNFGNYVSNKRMLAEHNVVEFFASRGRCLQRGQLAETEIADAVLTTLEPHFLAEREVHGQHIAGGSMIIDAVIRPREAGVWPQGDRGLGIEFKSPTAGANPGRRTSDLVAQCLDYAMSSFPPYGQIPVFLCPLPPGLQEEDSLMLVLARYNIGWIDFSNDEIWFRLGGQRLWRERKGVTTHGRTLSYHERRFGNRLPRK